MPELCRLGDFINPAFRDTSVGPGLIEDVSPRQLSRMEVRRCKSIRTVLKHYTATLWL